MSSTSTPDRDHPVYNAGVHYANNNNPVALRSTGTSYAQTLPGGACNILNLDVGMSPTIRVHPEINAITFIYD